MLHPRFSGFALIAVALLLGLSPACSPPSEDVPPTPVKESEDSAAPPSEDAEKPTPVLPAGAPPEEVGAILEAVSPESLENLVEGLASFGTRHTLSDTESETRGIGAARRWIHEKMRGYAGGTLLEASFDRHTLPPDGRRIPRTTEIVNVVATLPGTMEEARDRRYYVIGHYDSRASDVMDAEIDAPGANDDASGVALLMELARVMSQQTFDSTLVFMATAGEEQGLYGAALHAEAAREQGVDLRAVLSNDVVGDPSNPLGEPAPFKVRVFSQALPEDPTPEEYRRIRALGMETDSPSRQLARFVHQVASWEGLAVQPLLVFRNDRFLRGGDQSAFTRQGFPAVRFTEVYEGYTRQHQDVRTEEGVDYGDLAKHVDPEYLAGVTRLNGAVLAHLANAPSAPADARIVIAELTNETTLRWSASPEPDVRSYEVVWRKTMSPLWEHAKDVGNVTEITLPISKDNHFFGVRAYDRHGYRSPVSFAQAARE